MPDAKAARRKSQTVNGSDPAEIEQIARLVILHIEEFPLNDPIFVESVRENHGLDSSSDREGWRSQMQLAAFETMKEVFSRFNAPTYKTYGGEIVTRSVQGNVLKLVFNEIKLLDKE